MKTAMQQLIDKLEEIQIFIVANTEYADGYNGALTDCICNAEKLLELEKQQIIDAFNTGMTSSDDFFTPNFRECNESEQYYLQTYKQE